MEGICLLKRKRTIQADWRSSCRQKICPVASKEKKYERNRGKKAEWGGGRMTASMKAIYKNPRLKHLSRVSYSIVTLFPLFFFYFHSLKIYRWFRDESDLIAHRPSTRMCTMLSRVLTFSPSLSMWPDRTDERASLCLSFSSDASRIFFLSNQADVRAQTARTDDVKKEKSHGSDWCSDTQRVCSARRRHFVWRERKKRKNHWINKTLKAVAQ